MSWRHVVEGCIARSKNLYDQISPGLMAMGHAFNRRPDSYTFRMGMPGTQFGLSFSFAPDVNEHADEDDWVVETALWNMTEDRLIYNEQLGYDDVRRFSTLGELMEEIDRVHDAVRAPGFAAPVDDPLPAAPGGPVL